MRDTLGYVKKLEAVGFPREQAEAQVQIMTEVIETSLVTKQDFKDLEVTLVHDMKSIEYRLKMDLELFKTEVRNDTKNLESRLTIKLGAIMVAGIGALALLQKLG